MNLPYTVLIVDDEEQLCRIMSHKLRKEGFQTFQAYTGQDAIEILKKEEIDVVLLDYMLQDMTGIDVLQKIKADNDGVAVIMLTAYGNIESAVSSMKSGASDYLNKPVELQIIKDIVMKACENKKLQQENRLLKEQLKQTEQKDELIFDSNSMKRIVSFLDKVLETEASILILGESGVGKTALAKWIHEKSDRRDKPFVSLNCAAIPENLLESELFGYRKGAFTGATESRPGKFEAGDGGTIFLDEIGEITLPMQAKLLHVIEEKSFMKLGSNTTQKVDVRIITATNKEIRQLVKARLFREDLYYRLNLVEVVLPPLRERKEDIPGIVKSYLQKLNRKYHKRITVSDEALDVFLSYSWPGNVRELLNMMERIHILKSSGVIQKQDLSNHWYQDYREQSEAYSMESRWASLPLPDRNLQSILGEVEEEIINKALEKAGGNQTKAADLLGISRHTLIYKMKKKKM